MVLSGSQLVFSSPTPRPKSEELKARLRKLEELAKRNAYQKLVKDITSRKGTHEPFSSYKDHLGIGMLVETLLFIIRTSSQGTKPSTSTSKLKKNQ